MGIIIESLEMQNEITQTKFKTIKTINSMVQTRQLRGTSLGTLHNSCIQLLNEITKEKNFFSHLSGRGLDQNINQHCDHLCHRCRGHPFPS